MNRSQKRILKLTSGIVGLSFALITASVGTVAWFMASSRNKVEGIEISANQNIKIIDDQIYTLACEKDSSGNVIYNNGNPSPVKQGINESTKRVEDFTLRNFSRINTENNADANSIMHIGLEFPGGYDTDHSELVLSIYSSTTTPTYKTVINSLTSNVAGFKIYNYSYKVSGTDDIIKFNDDGFNKTDTSSDYQTLKSIFNDENHKYSTAFVSTNSCGKLNRTANTNSFVTIGGTQYQEINFIINDETLGTSIHNLDYLDFYLEVAYQQKFIDAFVNNYSESSASSSIEHCSPDIPKMSLSISDSKSNGMANTARFVRIDTEAQFVNDDYLISYDYENNDIEYSDIFDGSKATTTTAINDSNVRQEIIRNNKYIRLNNDSISSAITINKTPSGSIVLKKNTNYIGRDTTHVINVSDNLVSGYSNEMKLHYADSELICDYSNGFKFKYNTTGVTRKFGYYDLNTDNYKKINLYRFLENAGSLYDVADFELRFIDDEGNRLEDNYYETNSGNYSTSAINYYKDYTYGFVTYEDGTSGMLDKTYLSFSINGIENESIKNLTYSKGSATASVVVKYNEGGSELFSSSFTITVKVDPSALILDTTNVQTEFELNEEFNYENLKVKFGYQVGTDGDWQDFTPSSGPVKRWTITNPDMTTAGEKTITVSHLISSGNRVSASYTITVNGGGYVKVTEDLEDWTGFYLIVYQDTTTRKNRIWNGTSTTSNYVESNFEDDGNIISEAPQGSCIVEVLFDENDEDYNIREKDTEKYLACNNKDLVFYEGSEYTKAKFSISYSFTYTCVTDKSNLGNPICYNAVNDQKRFRFLSASSNEHIQLFKLGSVEPTPVTPGYYKVNNELDDWTGQYLISYRPSNSNSNYIWNGTAANSRNYVIGPSGDFIENVPNGAVSVDISFLRTESGRTEEYNVYSIKISNIDGYSNKGKYISNGDGREIDFGDNPLPFTISSNYDTCRISYENTWQTLQFNSEVSGDRFAFYGDGNQNEVMLFRYSSDSPTPPPTPEIKKTVSEVCHDIEVLADSSSPRHVLSFVEAEGGGYFDTYNLSQSYSLYSAVEECINHCMPSYLVQDGNIYYDELEDGDDCCGCDYYTEDGQIFVQILSWEDGTAKVVQIFVDDLLRSEIVRYCDQIIDDDDDDFYVYTDPFEDEYIYGEGYLSYIYASYTLCDDEKEALGFAKMYMFDEYEQIVDEVYIYDETYGLDMCISKFVDQTHNVEFSLEAYLSSGCYFVNVYTHSIGREKIVYE